MRMRHHGVLQFFFASHSICRQKKLIIYFSNSVKIVARTRHYSTLIKIKIKMGNLLEACILNGDEKSLMASWREKDLKEAGNDPAELRKLLRGALRISGCIAHLPQKNRTPEQDQELRAIVRISPLKVKDCIAAGADVTLVEGNANASPMLDVLTDSCCMHLPNVMKELIAELLRGNCAAPEFAMGMLTKLLVKFWVDKEGVPIEDIIGLGTQLKDVDLNAKTIAGSDGNLYCPLSYAKFRSDECRGEGDEQKKKKAVCDRVVACLEKAGLNDDGCEEGMTYECIDEDGNKW